MTFTLMTNKSLSLSIYTDESLDPKVEQTMREMGAFGVMVRGENVLNLLSSMH